MRLYLCHKLIRYGFKRGHPFSAQAFNDLLFRRFYYIACIQCCQHTVTYFCPFAHRFYLHKYNINDFNLILQEVSRLYRREYVHLIDCS